MSFKWGYRFLDVETVAFFVSFQDMFLFLEDRIDDANKDEE